MCWCVCVRVSTKGVVRCCVCACVCTRLCDLVEDVDVVVGQVEEHQPSQAAEGPLLHRADVAALQGQVRQVRGVLERPRGQLLDVVPSQVELHCNLVEKGGREKERERGREGENMSYFKDYISIINTVSILPLQGLKRLIKFWSQTF